MLRIRQFRICLVRVVTSYSASEVCALVITKDKQALSVLFALACIKVCPVFCMPKYTLMPGLRCKYAGLVGSANLLLGRAHLIWPHLQTLVWTSDPAMTPYNTLSEGPLHKAATPVSTRVDVQACPQILKL